MELGVKIAVVFLFDAVYGEVYIVIFVVFRRKYIIWIMFEGIVR